SDIFPTTYPAEADGYAERLIALLEQCVQRITELSAFKPFTRSEALHLNNVELWNLVSLFERCKNDRRVKESLRPRVVCKVHGDLYPENVLVHVPSLRRPQPRVMVLDPIAAIGLSRGDFAMDIAKCRSWLSAELLALRLGLFSIRKEKGRATALT